jgi:LPXTG-site transpeptidase (sortase) family protein
MQDIIPPRRSSRGTLRVPSRVMNDMRRPASAVQRTVYTRQTQMMSDILPNQKVIVTETFTTDYRPEAAPMTRPVESLSSKQKNDVLQKALFIAERELRKERRKRRDIKRFSLVLITSVFVLLTGYVSIDAWMTNNNVKAEVTETTNELATSEVTKETEGKDEIAPSVETLSTYKVASSLPRALYIDKLDIAARILPMGVNGDNSIQAPRNIFDAGWYTGSVKPGDIGAMFIDGHASGPTREGLFAYLDKLVIGDELQVEKGDGTRLSYRVVHTEVANLESLDMRKMLLPHGNTLRGLNLMTCSGDWLADQETFSQRVMVWTEQV